MSDPSTLTSSLPGPVPARTKPLRIKWPNGRKPLNFPHTLKTPFKPSGEGESWGVREAKIRLSTLVSLRVQGSQPAGWQETWLVEQVAKVGCKDLGWEWPLSPSRACCPLLWGRGHGLYTELLESSLKNAGIPLDFSSKFQPFQKQSSSLNVDMRNKKYNFSPK